MSPRISRIVVAALFAVLAGGLVFGLVPIFREVQQLSTTYGGGFVLMIVLMTVLVLISIVRMPLTHTNVRRRHR